VRKVSADQPHCRQAFLSAVKSAMSIRPEEAAAEASRFSLRSAILGVSNGVTLAAKPASPALMQRVAAAPARPIAMQQQLNPMHSKLMMNAKASIQANSFTVPAGMPTAPPAPPGPIQTTGLTFGSITGSAAQTPMAHRQQSNPTNQHAINTMRKLSELQRLSISNQAAAPRPPPNAPLAGAMASHRVLSAGYVNGGSVKGESSAELMRLTALVDSLNTKVAGQSERLQKTESSLIKANQAITSERASFNARVVRMQADLKSSKETENKLRVYAGQLETASTQKSQKLSFEEAAKQAEKFDTKLSSCEAQIAKLVRERDLLSTDLATESAKAEGALATLSAVKAELAAQIKSEKDAVASTAAGAESKIIEMQKQLSAIEHERDSLSMQLESTTKETAAQIEELDLKHKNAIEEIDSANSNVDAIVETRNRFQAELEISTHQLAEAKQELEALKNAHSSLVPSDMMFFEESVSHADGFVTATSATKPSYAFNSTSTTTPNAFALPRRPNKMEAKIAANAAMLAELGVGDCSFVPRAGPANNPFPSDFAAQTAVANAETGSAATEADAATDSKVSSLVKSVSMDITSACAHHRRIYLEAMEIPEDEIVKQMDDLMNEPVA
jgi:archaellum component FlaC